MGCCLPVSGADLQPMANNAVQSTTDGDERCIAYLKQPPQRPWDLKSYRSFHLASDALRSQFDQLEQLGQFSQVLGFTPLGRRELFARILPVEQVLESFLHSLGKTELSELAWDVELDDNGFGHFPFSCTSNA